MGKVINSYSFVVRYMEFMYVIFFFCLRNLRVPVGFVTNFDSSVEGFTYDL